MRSAGAQGSATVAATFSGANLSAIAAADTARQAGAPPHFAFTDVRTTTVGYDQGTSSSDSSLAYEFDSTVADPMAIAASVPNVFIRGTAADDALQAFGGHNVMDGGGGSNFLVGGTGPADGADQFQLDARGPDTTWSTVVNFHSGDSVTLYGFHAGVSTSVYTEADGIAGYRGLTLHSALDGTETGPVASLTLAGIDQATASAHMTITPGTLNAGTAQALDYLSIRFDH